MTEIVNADLRDVPRSHINNRTVVHMSHEGVLAAFARAELLELVPVEDSLSERRLNAQGRGDLYEGL